MVLFRFLFILYLLFWFIVLFFNPAPVQTVLSPGTLDFIRAVYFINGLQPALSGSALFERCAGRVFGGRGLVMGGDAGYASP